MANEQKHLSWLEKFLSKYYMNQPKWLRTIVYLMLALLLVYSFYRIIGGEFSVRGSILLQETQERYKPVKSFDVQVGDKNFGTNSLGLYYIILGPTEYGKLMIQGELSTTLINKDEETFFLRTLKFSRFNQEFDRLILSEKKANPLRKNNELGKTFLDSIVSSANAAVWKQEGDRLFITEIKLSSKLPNVKEVTFDLHYKNSSFELLSSQTGGMPAGKIPVISGKTVDLEKSYFFNVPQNMDTSNSKIINISLSRGNFLTQLASGGEDFEISVPQDYGSPFKALGDRGSQITLMLLSKYDVIIWKKYDLENILKELETVLTNNGFRVVEKLPPLGYKSQTNAIFGGKSVPYTIIQTILGVLHNKQISIKTIQYKLDLRSGNPNEIQIGGSARFDNAPPIRYEKIIKLLNAQSEKEFTDIEIPE